MSKTLLTCQIPNIEKTDTSFIKTPIYSSAQKLPEKLRKVIVKLERLDIGWLDILTAMANITEQRGDEQMVEMLEAIAMSLKQNRKIIRDL